MSLRRPFIPLCSLRRLTMPCQTTISLVVLFVRKSYFKSRCEDAVRMARQQRHERDLVRMKRSGTQSSGIFQRARTRAQTFLGWQPTPIIEPRPEAQENGLDVREKGGDGDEKGRERGESTVTSVHKVVSSDPSSEESANAQETAANGNGVAHPNSNGYSLAYLPNNVASPPPTFTQTAPTPSPTLGILPEVGVTDSPADELEDPTRSHPPHGSNKIDPATPTDRNRPRPRSLAVGHESDRNVKKLGNWRMGEGAGEEQIAEMVAESKEREEDRKEGEREENEEAKEREKER